MPIEREEKSEFRGHERWLLLAFAIGPLAVLSHLNVSYALNATACAQGTKAILHISSAVFALVAAIGVVLARRGYNACAHSTNALWRERTRWLATVAMVLALASIVVIAAMEIPNWILRSCD